MKNKYLIIISFLIFQTNYSQKNVKMISEYGSTNDEINSLMLFQNISTEKLTFESNELIGKFYEVNLKEYKNGKLIKKTKIFDYSGDEYFKIDTSYTSFKFFNKIEDDKLTVFIQSPKMYGEKKTFKLEKGKSEDYLLKDFQGEKKFVNVSSNEEFPILTIITPSQQEETKGSYCDVAQSEIAPEKYWEKFEIPHYFVISMKFK
ncbi:hypothetical protein Q361_1565 [Flavobacterium croceum DSM 17960]|uniref:Uncharacterized protein n=1 Tax=Flavobacterium croceum DSM 17960 TaxID=1121886 RepID=A0A2S4N4G7_9FLAO|nr:hypothetical protein [Flavobacterium croceum]POS00576.1 hypothetical protein Q361_1565 [Flavobacterium croceum DSM 17960]